MPSLNFLKRRRTKHGHSNEPSSPVQTSQPAGTGRRSLSSLLHRSSVSHHPQSQSQSQSQQQPAQNGTTTAAAAPHPVKNTTNGTATNGTATKPETASLASDPTKKQSSQQTPTQQPSLQSQEDQHMSNTGSTPPTTANPSAASATAAAGSSAGVNKVNSQDEPQNISKTDYHLDPNPPQHDGASDSSANPSTLAPPPASLAPALVQSPSPGTDPAALLREQQQAHPPPPQPPAANSPAATKMQAAQHSDGQSQQPQQPQAQQPQQHSEVAQPSQARVTKGKYSLTDFDILRTLGTGSFGRVHLVQSKHNQRFYAVKVLKKAQVVKMKQVEHTNDERRMLSDVKHPFLITLWGTFQDWKNVYMVMDFVEGGELFSLLRKSGRFPNPVAKFYAAEVTLALEYLHSKNIIYRDLKPENLLLDRHGHLKITDFGFAKRVPDKTWTLCGTPDYLAPEVVSNKGYNKSVDWWSLGILIYEMLCGYTPFWDSGSPMKIYENILKGKVKYPAYVNADAQNLLERLITSDLTKRLGNLYGGPQDVKNHPWFAEVTWDRLARKDIDAPYTPPVKAGMGDASQFDRYPEETEKYGQTTGNDEHGHLFKEF